MSPEPDDEDVHLVRRLIRRDGEAWRELVDRFGGTVSGGCRSALLRAGQPADTGAVADAVADVFRLLLEKDLHLLRKYRSGRKLAAYLRVIAWSRTLNASRGLRHGLPLDEAQVENTAAAAVEDSDRSERLREALADLPPKDAEVLRWFYQDGLSYAEIARRSGLGVSGVGMALARARERLRALLGEESP